MSINDLLNDDSFLTIMVYFLVIILVSLPISIVIMRKKANKNIYSDDKYKTVYEEKDAKVLARRTSPHPLYQTVMINMVVFELTNGSRLELTIKDSNKHSTIFEGDCGFLVYQGKTLISFERNT